LPQQIIIRNFKNHIQRGLFEWLLTA
jgi:hypothetical protein